MSNDPKKPQRTKGNVKPSSSSKAAQALTDQGLGNVEFIGFGDQFESEDLNPNFRLCFRKIMKKDPTTKIKALKELLELVNECDQNEVVQAWQFWPKIYTKISLDSDIKVREESHNVLGSFFQKLGRLIASQLKTIMPFLLIGQNDPYSSVAQSAKANFQIVFPTQAKQAQALTFCKEAIITECSEILKIAEKYGKIQKEPVSKTGFSGLDKKLEDKESAEIRFQRLNCCALNTLNQLLKEIDEKEICIDYLKSQIFDQPKFWNLIKHKSGPMKNSWIEFISTIIEKFADF